MNNERCPVRIAYKKAWRAAHRDQERASQRDAYKVWREANPLPVKEKVVKVVKVRKVAVPRSNKRDGLSLVVYVIQAGEYVKVGIAENLAARLSVFKCHNPIPVSVAYCSNPMFRPEARKIEVGCHSLMGESRANGEWFKVAPEVAVGHLKSLLGVPQES